MADISTLLDRAATTPTRGPDIDGPFRGALRRRIAARSIVTAVVIAAIAVAMFGVLRPKQNQLRVASRPTTTLTPGPSEYHDTSHGFSIQIPSGWYRAERPLEPWLESPHEILSLATVPLSPSSLSGNQAACASEIPKVAVQGIGPDGAYLWIGQWIPGEGIYTAEPRPAHAASLHWQRECPLPNGITAVGATFRDGTRDFSVHLVLGADATARRTELYAILDTFRPDAETSQPPTTTTPTATTTAAGTEQITYQPFTAHGTVDPNLQIRARLTGTCVTGESSRSYRCFGSGTTGGIYDPCFASPSGAAEPLVCPTNPAVDDVVEFTATSLPSAAPVTTTRPWAMQLADGQVCLFVSAAWSGLGPYGCRTGTTPIWADCRPPQPSQPWWTTQCQYQQTQDSAFIPNRASRIWF